MTLTKKVHELEEKLSEQRTELSALQNDHEHIVKDATMRQQENDLEAVTLTKACEMQKANIEVLTVENSELKKYNKELSEKHKQDMLHLEEEFNEERNTIKEKLHEVI